MGVNIAVGALLAVLPKDYMKRAIDAVIDVAEDAVKATDNKLDDLIVNPLCKAARNILDVPDNDDPAEA